ncbi:hypothetical protein ACS0TY_018336 [Phlomoides rotata]
MVGSHEVIESDQQGHVTPLLWFSHFRLNMRGVTREHGEILLVLGALRHRNFMLLAIAFAILWWRKIRVCLNRRRGRFSILDRNPAQLSQMTELVHISDEDCKNNLRMDRAAFHLLCQLLYDLGGLRNSRYVNVQEKVTVFLTQTVGTNNFKAFSFRQSVLKLHYLLLTEPQLVPDDSTDPRWESFKGCLKALDSTYIDVQVPSIDKPRYKNRKGQITVNVLGVCDMNMKFVYVFTGWEGSAADSRVLHDAITRTHGLRVPKGNYYLSAWSSRRPQNYQEYLNMKHTRAQNCLVEIVNSGWKVDNGFKAGFQRELEKGMKKLLPGTDLVVNPHINSKIHVWKKEYGALSDLLSKSGICWNDSTHTIDVFNEDVWEAKKRADPQVKTMRYKSWPYYGQWLDIFGKDRATGEHIMDPIDTVNDLVRNKEPIASEPVEGQVENTFACDKSEVEEKTIKGKKRKVADSELGAFVETIGELIKSNDQTFNSLAQHIGPGQEAKITRKSLNEIVRGIPGLSLQVKLKVCDDLVQNTKRLNFFLSLPEDEQAKYIYMLLDGCLT